MLLYNQITTLDPKPLKQLMSRLFEEDIPNGDPTTNTIIKPNQEGTYVFRARETMIFCGGPIIQNTLSDSIKVKLLVQDGQSAQKGADLAIIVGSVREILTKERLILNMIQHLSGVASNTAQYVKELNNNQIKVLDTRKTTPGLRLLEKYAVNMGGGCNHRLDLSSGIMVKDNHFIHSNIDSVFQTLAEAKNHIKRRNLSFFHLGLK